MRKKKNMLTLIDGENISAKRATEIMRIAKTQGVPYESKVYGLQKDPRTKGWSDKAKLYDIKDIRLYGIPEKNKVDKKVQKDARNEVNRHKNIDTVLIVSSDGGYTETVRELRSMGKRVIIIGEQKTPKRLRESCSWFIEIR